MVGDGGDGGELGTIYNLFKRIIHLLYIQICGTDICIS